MTGCKPVVVGVDPGPERAAVVVLKRGQVPGAFIENQAATDGGELERFLSRFVGVGTPVVVAMEMIAGQGMKASDSTMQTAFAAGRIVQAVPRPWCPVRRVEVKQHLLGNVSGNDAQVRAALVKHWGGKAATRKGGDLALMRYDLWAALAVAVTVWDQWGSKYAKRTERGELVDAVG